MLVAEHGKVRLRCQGGGMHVTLKILGRLLRYHLFIVFSCSHEGVMP